MFHTLRPRACDETASFCKHSHPSPLVSVTQCFFVFFKTFGFLIPQKEGGWLVDRSIGRTVFTVTLYNMVNLTLVNCQ